jgi:hypothetical protein
MNAVKSGGHVPRSAQPSTKLPKAKLTAKSESSLSQNANLEQKREFAPYFKRSAEMGGSKRAVIPLLWHGGSKKTQRFTKAGAVCGGEQAQFAGGADPVP